MADKSVESYKQEGPNPDTSSGNFHALADDEKYPTAAPCPVKVMGSTGKERVFKDTTEAPCDSDSKPMDADSTARRK